MPPTPRRTGTLLLAAVLTAAAQLAPVPAAAAPTAPDRIETPVASTSPVAGVTETEVSVHLPLPDSVGPHPAGCDWLSYLRWRDAAGPADSDQADKVLVAQPGIFEGAGAFDSVARDTVAAAAAKGRHIEFWALDRRSNCLEDHTGVRSGDLATAVGYYYKGQQVDGHTFGGFASGADTAFLAKIGMAQTVQDEYDLITHELPADYRATRLLCGGHSLGGIITGYFATWDFDGQAGADQCAGWFALDTEISTSFPLPGLGSITGTQQLDPAAYPVLKLPALINPETMNLLDLTGLAARQAPDAASTLLQDLPHNSNLDTTLRVLFSQNLAHFVSGTPSIRDFHFTNTAALGAVLDDNSMPLNFLQASVGFVTGGPVAAKNFPVPNAVLGLPVAADLFGAEPKVIPTDTTAAYGWQNYDQITPNPYTTPAKEVTDIGELARSLSQAPLDFTEWYFPTKLAVDSMVPDATMKAHSIHPDGVQQHPTLMIAAGSGIGLANLTTVPPNTTYVVAPYYHHLDVVTAAPMQNNGQPEIVSTDLADFAMGD